MPPSDDFAITCLVSELNHSLSNKKVRIAGKIISYDPITHILLLAHPPYGVLVDISLCLDPSQSLHYLRENKGTLMVMGSLEHTPAPLEVPLLSQFVDAPSLDDRLVLRAILARSVNDLSLERWTAALEAKKKASKDTHISASPRIGGLSMSGPWQDGILRL